ncbi:hypothetical protein HDV00_003729 [Rhizophlyctis rosea]|nr:hypothetical protein HDV00_003729 [Rhizophlyctis rosea]
MGQTTSILKQSFNIPAPTFTEKNLPDQAGKVHIVTGGYAGCGFELARYLYQKNATVYIAGRSEEKAAKAIQALKEEFPGSGGRLEFMKVDLQDLKTIKPGVDSFLQNETRLDVLTNNAGVMTPPAGSKDAYGHELQMGTNCLVRVTFAASLIVEIMSPTNGIEFDPETNAPKVFGDPRMDYAHSKAGNFFLAHEFARRYTNTNVLSVAWNPGNLKSELQRHTPPYQEYLMRALYYPAKLGGYTELFAGWSPEVTKETNGGYIIPWGRIDTENLRADVLDGDKEGVAAKFWEWCEKETSGYR